MSREALLGLIRLCQYLTSYRVPVLFSICVEGAVIHEMNAIEIQQ